MENIGRAVGTIAVWGGIALVCHILGGQELLDSKGVGWMVAGGFFSTFCIWARA